ncbi:DUF5685 family protein [Flammeovirga sp. EKP202]|uniref:DUF5685 family protein n=1 Tax=Flammeovirga sp. EKP202 TaxID=2770592 RepID=UPI00165F6A25|nr:DUF5685 family protein [Flammeovirga sp. EKP202]MBD0404521.1 hypothetical protein [Flammeovirga sp. EKP202]
MKETLHPSVEKSAAYGLEVKKNRELMFGILKQNLCKVNTQISSHHYNYCGTCKSIGKLYGLKSRAFLNNDIVFLSSLMNDLYNAEANNQILKKSCLSLPKIEDLTDIFRYTSSLNIFLSHLKLQDNYNDSVGTKKIISLLGNLIYKDTFLKSIKNLMDIGFPNKKVNNYLDLNEKVEKIPELAIDSYIEPTARITELCFEFGANLINVRAEKVTTMKKIGWNLGSLVYLNDVVLDYPKDIQAKNFNPIIKSSKVSLEKVKNYLESTKKELIVNLKSLGLTQSLESRYTRTIGEIPISYVAMGSKKSKFTNGFADLECCLDFSEITCFCTDSCCSCEGCDCGGCDCGGCDC